MTTEAGVKRVQQLTEETADLLCDIKDRAEELMRDHGIGPLGVVELVARGLGSEAMNFYMQFMSVYFQSKEESDATPSGPDAVRAQIDQMFKDAPASMDGSDPAIPEVHVVLRGSIPPVAGALARCPSGCLKLGTMTKNKDGKAVLLEQFFTYEDIVAVAVQREIKTEISSLFTAH